MKKFIVIYHAPVDAMEETSGSAPEQQAKGMEDWMKWAQNCGEKLIDLGSPLSNGQQITPDGKSSPSKKNVAGYSVLQAENIEEATKLLKGHPHLAWNAALLRSTKRWPCQECKNTLPHETQKRGTQKRETPNVKLETLNAKLLKLNSVIPEVK